MSADTGCTEDYEFIYVYLSSMVLYDISFYFYVHSIEENLGDLYIHHLTVVTALNFYVMYVSVYRRDFR